MFTVAEIAANIETEPVDKLTAFSGRTLDIHVILCYTGYIIKFEENTIMKRILAGILAAVTIVTAAGNFYRKDWNTFSVTADAADEEVQQTYKKDGYNSFIYVNQGDHIEIKRGLYDIYFIDSNGLPYDKFYIPAEIDGLPVSDVYYQAFYTSAFISSFTVDENNKYFCSIDGSLFSKDKTELVHYATGRKTTSYTIPDTVTKICDAAFYQAVNLSSIIIPDSVTEIGSQAFNYSTITKLEIPDSVTELGGWSFSYCDNLKSVKLSNKLKEIKSITFCPCPALTSLTIPDSVEKIDYNAIGGCTSLTSITIPASVTYLDEYNFNNCTKLTAISVDEDNPSYCDIDGVLYNKDKTRIIRYPSAKKGATYSIEPVTKTIAECAFNSMNNLTTIFVPYSVENIEEFAFAKCPKLERVVIMGNIKSLRPVYTNGPKEVSFFYDYEGVTKAKIYGKRNSFIQEYAEKFDIPFEDYIGDCNGDFRFSIADLVLLQKWILNCPNTELKLWDAVDMDDDGHLDCFDLARAKGVLIWMESYFGIDIK